MSLIIFNRTNTSTSRQGERTINMRLQGGNVAFSKNAIKSLKVKSGDNVIFAKDKDKPKTWFIAVDLAKDDNSFELSKPDKNGTILFRSTGLVKKVLEDFKQQKAIRFLIAKEGKEINGVKFFQLIPFNKK